ncbi:MAG: hypothetical protein HYY34_06430, partial [Chloroflexi bacterium]|nr:hypothetical protein [Chloroflexota bacterium]
LLNLSIKGAKGVLFSVKGGEGLTLGAVNASGELIGKAVRKDAAIFFGMSIDRSLDDDVKLTLIATGLKENVPNGFSLNPFKGIKRGNEHPYESSQTGAETYTALTGNGKVIPGSSK